MYTYHGGVNDISINDGKVVGQGDDGVRAGLRHKLGKHTPCTQVRGPLKEVTPILRVGIFPDSRTRNPNFPIPIPNFPNPKIPIAFSGR